jgi:hypothetical protein
MIMMVSVMITVASVSLIFYQIWRIEHIQSDILSLYAYLSRDHINATYSKAQAFMKEIAEGSFINQISPKKTGSMAGSLEGEGSGARSRVIDYLYFNKTQEGLGSRQRQKEGSIYALMIKRAGQEMREMTL